MSTHIEYTDLDFFDAIGAIVDDCLDNPGVHGFIHIHADMDEWNKFRDNLKSTMSERFGIYTVRHHGTSSVITFNNTTKIIVSCTITGGYDDEYVKKYLPNDLRGEHFHVGLMHPKMPLLKQMEKQMRSFQEFTPRIYNVIE